MAKQMIKINTAAKTAAKTADLTKIKADVLAIGVFSKGSNSGWGENFDAAVGGDIKRLKKIGDFKGDFLDCAFLYTHGRIAAERVLLIGLGEEKKVTPDIIRAAASKAAFEAVKVSAQSLALYLAVDKIETERLGKIIAEGIHFGGYRYDEFVSKKSTPAKLSATVIAENLSAQKKLTKGIGKGQIIGTAQNFARTLCNRPGNVIYPASLAAVAKKIASSTANLSCTVLNKKQLIQKKMGGIIAVGQGSKNEPKMIIMKYSPKGSKKSKSAPIGLVGKAITFDSGGISLKPSANMHEMKYDMTGGATVLMTMQAIAKLKPSVEVIGIICAAENRPDAGSYLPGDIIKTYSGKTVEILNTDAEGRMVLCDGLHHAKVLKCKTVIDVATLTGACVVALGKHKAGLFSNDDKLAGRLKAASANTAEPVWPMPYGDEYLEDMKSKIADLQNCGSRWGGSCTAAAFLGEFAKDLSWAHIDIAGMSDTSKPVGKYSCSGSIGFGVRLLSDFVVNLK